MAEYITTHKEGLHGTFKLILQPAEEGVRGAKSMVDAGVVDDVDIFFGMHIGINKNIAGCLACLNNGFLATTKLDVTFKATPLMQRVAGAWQKLLIGSLYGGFKLASHFSSLQR